MSAGPADPPRLPLVRWAVLTVLLLAELGLELSPEKTRIVDLNVAGGGFDFLGFHFRRLPVRRDPDRRYCACWPSRRRWPRPVNGSGS